MRPILRLLVLMAVIAAIVGVIGYFLAAGRFVVLLEPMASRVPEDRHVRFIIALWVHGASYAAGAIGGLVLIVCTWRRRGRLATVPNSSASVESPVQDIR